MGKNISNDMIKTIKSKGIVNKGFPENCVVAVIPAKIIKMKEVEER